MKKQTSLDIIINRGKTSLSVTKNNKSKNTIEG